MSLPDLRYPIGPYVAPDAYSLAWRQARIAEIAAVPAAMRAALLGLTEAQLDTPYRPDGWTVRQVAHHLPDSHLNAYIRLKWALTEERPTIKPYDEERWALLEDSRSTPIDVSLSLLEAVHDRFVRLWRALSDAEFERRYVHPATGEHTVHHLLGLYAWHGLHHVAHVTALRARAHF
jgi:hypothetical protein